MLIDISNHTLHQNTSHHITSQHPIDFNTGVKECSQYSAVANQVVLWWDPNLMRCFGAVYAYYSELDVVEVHIPGWFAHATSGGGVGGGQWWWWYWRPTRTRRIAVDVVPSSRQQLASAYATLASRKPRVKITAHVEHHHHHHRECDQTNVCGYH